MIRSSTARLRISATNSAPLLLTPIKPPAIEPNPPANLLADCASKGINFAAETYCLGMTNATAIAAQHPVSAQHNINCRLAPQQS
jgi:hypothetical protein